MIKKYVDLIKEKSKSIFKEYPVTLITIFIFTLFLIIFLDYDTADAEIFENICLFLTFYSFGAFFTEVIFSTKEKRIGFFTIFLILSAILVYLAKNNNLNTVAVKVIGSYLIIINALSIFFLYRKNKVNVEHYLISVCENILRLSLVYSILSFGILLISEVFSYLILGESDFDFILRIEILLFGFFYVPGLIMGITSIRKKISNFIKIIVHYTMGILIDIAYLIIYLYIIKIFITWNIPSNEIFRILGSLFIITAPIIIMNDYYKDDIFYKINHKLPMLFIPFILLEIYSIFIRIQNNGITILRYLGILLIVFEIIFIYLFYFKEKNKEYNLLAIIVLTVISLLIPYINMYDTSNLSQINIIRKYLNNENISNNEKSRITSSYRYLRRNNDGNKYIEKYLSKREIETIESYSENSWDNEYHYYYGEMAITDYKINDYHTMTSFTDSSSSSNIYINYKNDQIDLTPMVNEYLESNNKVDFNIYFSTNNILEIDNLKIIITSMNFNTTNNKISYYNISGIILEKWVE